jgi:ABC-type transport system substrate-binding protein
LDEAARTSDRVKRMAIYRQVDHLLVAEESLVLIFSYSKGIMAYLVKPWVKNYSVSLLGKVDYQNIILEDH